MSQDTQIDIALKLASIVEKQMTIAINALNDIASWTEGPEVTPSFDEPASAQQARNALIAIGNLNANLP